VLATAQKLLRYFLTAGTAAIVDVGGFALLRHVEVRIAVAAVVSFCLAAIVNFFLTSRFVFGHAPSVRGFTMFFVAALGGLLINVSVTLLGSLYFGIVPELAKVGGVGTAFLCNFWLNLRVVFRKGAVPQGSEAISP
jgi:putative flippase GtrA